MKKCRKCEVELIEDENNTYEDDVCDDCFEKECDEQLAEMESDNNSDLQ